MLTVKVSTCYGDVIVPVRLLARADLKDRVWVQSLNGMQPWTRYTSGGPCQTDTAVVFVDHIVKTESIQS